MLAHIYAGKAASAEWFESLQGSSAAAAGPAALPPPQQPSRSTI